MRVPFWAAHIGRDVRHAARMIRRMPALAAVVVGSLGIGIGVNTAVFSWIQTLLLRPLPGVADATRFHLIEPRSETGGYPGVSWREYRDLETRLPSFDTIVAFRMAPFDVGAADWSERTFGLLVSGNYFPALGLTPALGRFIRPEEAVTPGGAPVVVISHGFWKSRFNGATSAIGDSVRVNDRPLAIVGVAPEGFRGTTIGLTFDLWVPATLAPALIEGSRELENRGQRGYGAIGRLLPRATRDLAQQELDAAMREFARDYPDTNRTVTGEVMPFWQAPRGPQRFMLGALALLQAVLILVLLAVCGNTANLLLARASVRRREMGVRLALGSGRWRVASLVLTESLVLAAAGAALGIVVAFWATDALRAVPMPTPFGIRIQFDTGLDLVSLAFAALLGLLSGLVFGLAPAVQLARLHPQPSLRAGSQAGGRSRLRDALMGAEVALALVVLVIAGIFLKSFNETQSTDPGFRREGVLLAAYDLRGRGQNVQPADATAFARRLLDDLRSRPSVTAAAIATGVPLDIHGLPSRSFVLEGRGRADGVADQALTITVTPGYFETMDLDLRSGRDFTSLTDAASAPEAVVNEAFVRRYLDQTEPLGRRLETAGRDYVIVGVVKTSLYNAYGEPPTPFIYLSFRDRPSTQGEIHVRTRDDGEMLAAPDLRAAVRNIDPRLPLYTVRTLTDHVETNLVFRRIPARMFAVLGPLLLALAAVGIYAVVAYSVSQRTTEIGMRLALGATAARVVRQLVGQTLRVIGAGVLFGWAIAFVINRDVVRGGTLDPLVFAGVPAVLLLVAAAACWLPARRAARIDPLKALRQE